VKMFLTVFNIINNNNNTKKCFLSSKIRKIKYHVTLKTGVMAVSSLPWTGINYIFKYFKIENDIVF